MLTLKFGGTSMGSCERIIKSADIIMQRRNATNERLSVVVSAVATVSNTLQKAIDDAVAGGNGISYIDDIKKLHLDICKSIEAALNAQTPGSFSCDKVMAELEPHFVLLRKSLDAVSSFMECPPTVYCRIMGMGELLSSPIMAAVLRAKGLTVELLDTRNFIYTTGDQGEGIADYTRCDVAFASFKDGMMHDNTQVLLFPGFICTWRSDSINKDNVGLLGRNGSDYSAAIVAASLDASRVEFWTDVDGVYTSDPKVVKDAIIINNMSYEEAMELSFFGSKVLHPRTLAPLQRKSIEAWSLNSANPSAHGTRICKGCFTNERQSVLCGISALKKVAMISISGSALRGKQGMAGRIFNTVANAGSSMLLITQSSSEYTISFCVKQSQSDAVRIALTKEFALEIKEHLINAVVVKDECAIVSIVGDGMVSHLGVATKFMNALSSRAINIYAIAQGSSERCISCVIDNRASDDAVRITHDFFFKKARTIQVFAFGAGTIGGELLNQIQATHDALLKQNIDVKVLAITTIDGMLLNENGINLSTWREVIKTCESDVYTNALPDGTQKYKFGPENVDTITGFVRDKKFQNAVFVDCTASYDLPDRYLDILKSGMSIVTPNKRANSKSQDFYNELRRVAKGAGKQFLYETNVGAGLPIIGTLQDLYKTGDNLVRFTGIMSGSLSYIFGALDQGTLFSKAVSEAKELRYTEPDPRDDLRGTDVARKALIIARESGISMELENIKMTNIFPAGFDTSGTIDDFMKKLPQVDDYFKQKVESLKSLGKVLRMGATIEVGEDGSANVEVGMMEVDEKSPLYSVRGGENAFVFFTARYQPLPLTIKGYGAGAGVTASGVYADVLKTLTK